MRRTAAACALLTAAVAHAGPVDPQTLPELKLSADPVKGEPNSTAIYADGANLDQLLVAVAPRGGFIAITTGLHITGTVHAPTREAAFMALAGLAPEPRAFVPAVIHGKGATVELSFFGAPTFDLLRLLAAVLHANVVAAPGQLPALDIVFHHAPADGVLDRLATVLGRDAVHVGNEVYVVPHGTKLPSPVKPIGSTITIDMHDATASDALLAINQVVPLDVHVTCDAGPKLDLRLHKIDAKRAAYAIAIASGLDLEPGAAKCPIVVAPPSASSPGRLTAIVTRGEDHTALFVDGSARGFVKRVPDVTDVGEWYVTFIAKPNGKALSVTLWPQWAVPVDLGPDQFDTAWTSRPLRLAATIIEPTRSEALLEGAAGDDMSIDSSVVHGKVTIEPARVVVEFTDPRSHGAPTYERRLERR